MADIQIFIISVEILIGRGFDNAISIFHFSVELVHSEAKDLRVVFVSFHPDERRKVLDL